MARTHTNRRGFLAGSTTAAATFFIGRRKTTAAPTAKIIETRVITPSSEPYCGWPTLIRRRNGELWIVYSGGRDAHVCPFGQVRCMTSRDKGATWTWPRVLLDGAIDDRDAGIVETPNGTLLVTTFTSLAYEPILAKAEAGGSWDADRLARWQAAHNRLSAEERKAELGTWMIRSTDDGRTFSNRFDCLVDSPHGPTVLSDGRILYAGKQLWRENPRIGVAVSSDDGASWEWLAQVPTRDGDDPIQYHELHAVECPSGRLIAQIRNHNAASKHETLQTESEDGGKTWSEPHSIGVWGYPSQLLRLRDGRLLMTYGHRRKPIGNQARISRDEGRSWSDPMLISADATSTDLGYPTTAQPGDDSLLTVWYEKLADRPVAVLRQARWMLSD